MNIRYIALLIALIALPTLAQTVDKYPSGKNITTQATERAALLQTLNRGSSVISNSQEYQILPGVRAAEIIAHEQPQQALSRMGGGKLIETKGSFVIFFAAEQSQASVTSVNGTSYPTALNPRTGGIGIVPGTLSVKLRNTASASAIASDHGLDVVRVFAHLQTAFYRVKPGQDVVAVAAALTADARVASVEVEVVEHMNVPH
jgi:hypothetical protein